ncbi:hypothetical protein WU86_00350 [Corynebacterium xerosis]|nr:hypothetical protein WU86_00350 [Corynebacterium xerosis]
MRVAVIPCGRPSSAVTAARPARPAFDAAYGAECGRGVWAAMEPLKMIRPPAGSCAAMARKAPRAVRNAPVRLISTVSRKPSALISPSGAVGPGTPALITARSRRPKSAAMPANSASTSDSSMTSQRAQLSASGDSAHTASRGAGVRPQMRTVHPSATRARATSAPMPAPPPVTSA